MAKGQNLAFIGIVAVCLLVVFGCACLRAVIPDFGKDKSVLEGRVYQVAPELSQQSLAEGDFQDELEQYVADSVPKRDGVLLANAKLQRSVIELANGPFGYNTYPTFFGSSYVYSPVTEGVYEKPKTKLEYSAERIDGFVDKYSALIDDNPEVNWAFCMPDRSGVSTGNPAYGLSSNKADYEYFKENFLDRLPTSCRVVDASCADAEEFGDLYLQTDHHWNIRGALRAYERVAQAFGKTPTTIDGVTKASSDIFWGAPARVGLSPEGSGDLLFDAVYKRSSISVVVDGKRKKESFLDKGYSLGYGNYEKSERFTNMYADYFHSDFGLIEMTNEDLDDGDTLLIVGDSFSDCMERFFAENYKKVYVFDQRHNKEPLDEFIKSHDIDDAVFLLGYTNL